MRRTKHFIPQNFYRKRRFRLNDILQSSFESDTLLILIKNHSDDPSDVPIQKPGIAQDNTSLEKKVP